MAKLVVYSAIFGGKDTFHEDQLQIRSADYVMFTDRPLESSVWKVFQVKPEFPNDPVRSAKVFKLQPHIYLRDYDYSFWIDGNMSLKTSFMQELEKSDFKGFAASNAKPKFERYCLYTEAQQCIKLKKDSPEIIDKQVRAYRAEGMPENFGLWECGSLLREHNRPEIISLHRMWWRQILKYSRRDQISLPYVAWKTGFRPNNLWGFRHYVYRHTHVRKTDA